MDVMLLSNIPTPSAQVVLVLILLGQSVSCVAVSIKNAFATTLKKKTLSRAQPT